MRKIDYWRKKAIVKEEDLNDSFIDSYGVMYSNDGKRLLKGCDLYKYEVREGTEVICNDAFDDCYPVEHVKFPKSLKYIGDRAFQSTFPDELSFPEGLLGIGECAYHFTRGRLKELVIPDSVVFIGKAAFHRMYHVEKVVLGNGIETIPELMFAGCSDLKHLILPETITAIKNSAFEYCPIKKIVIPENVKEIGDNPFCDVKKLECLSEHFIFEDNVLYSKDKKELIICNTKKKIFKVPDGVQVIRPFAFNDSKAECVILPESIVEIGKEAFCRSKLRTIIMAQGVKTIGDYAFSFSDLESIDLPDSITCIGKNAFLWCEKLKEVHFPIKLKEIGDSAFYLCKALDNVQLPDKLSVIGDSAFAKCYNLKEISLPKSVKCIGCNPFLEIENLKISCLTENYIIENGILYSIDRKKVICFIGSHDKIQIPEGVEIIGADAFNRSHITSVILPSSLRKIEKSAFSNCKELSEINIPDSLSAIGEGAFESCNKLSIIKIPESVSVIGADAFYGCEMLNIKSLPKHLKVISANTFFGSGITEIVLPEELEIIGDKAFSCCRKLKIIEIPLHTRAIGKEAFNACESLESVILPQNVETIGCAAFRLCKSLKEIKLPPISELQDALFEYSDSLTDIYIQDSVRKIGKRVFSDVKPNYSLLSPRIAEMIDKSKLKDLEF